MAARRFQHIYLSDRHRQWLIRLHVKRVRRNAAIQIQRIARGWKWRRWYRLERKLLVVQWRRTQALLTRMLKRTPILREGAAGIIQVRVCRMACVGSKQGVEQGNVDGI